MKWSKTKKAIEQLLADSVRDHVHFHMTRYGPGVSHSKARAWITWDKKELVNMSTAESIRDTYILEQQIQEANRTTDFKDPRQREGYFRAHQEAEEIVQKKGVLSRFQFEEAVEEYLGLSITKALVSDNPIIKALAVLDRRVGKRRLEKIHLDQADHPLVRLFYALRCKAEGIVGDRA